MGSYLIKKSLRIGEHEFNFSIEAHFWICFEEIAHAQMTTAERLAQSIVAARIDDHLPSAIRTYVLEHFQRQKQSLEKSGPVPSAAMSMDLADAWSDGSRPRWVN